ncbi:hypothetical protein KKC_03749, partial [Listeria fleischmannii subsp. coloradonensis]
YLTRGEKTVFCFVFNVLSTVLVYFINSILKQFVLSINLCLIKAVFETNSQSCQIFIFLLL